MSISEKTTNEASILKRSNGVVFEEYLHYAAIQRRSEEISFRSPSSTPVVEKRTLFPQISGSNKPNIGLNARNPSPDQSLNENEIERTNASRALRSASWASIFYLITTDILGPFNAPFAISQVGWVPGIILYFFMGVAAMYTGILLWRLFIHLDSLKYPVKTYSDLMDRIFGRAAHHACNVLQSLQLIIVVATICLSNGQAVSQISQGRLCFSICIVIWAFLGMFIGQIRTLKTYGWLANCAVWINLTIIFVSMGFIAHSPPNFEAAEKSLGVAKGPIRTEKFGSLPLFSRINGIMNMVYAYGGGMIFPEMMAEMKRPMDFWKGMAVAQALIFTAYVVYGAFVYSFQGQFTLPLAYQGVSKFAWQTVGNALSLVTGIIAAGLYGNIGIKVVYVKIVEEWLDGPRLMSKRGRYLWSVMVIMYWALAFIVGSAIPQVQTITGLIGAIAVMQFTYTFPPLLRLGYDVMTDAMGEDETYIPGRGISGRVDNWHQWSRWRRGLFGGRWYYKLFNLVIFLGGLAMGCLGMWGAGESIRAVFENSSAATSFGCKAPV